MRDMKATYTSDDDWEELLLTDSSLCLKYANRGRRWIHQLWESRTDEEYFKLCKILTEFPDKFREYYLLTYLLTPWSRVLLEKLTGFAANQEIPHISWNPKFITVLTSARHLSLYGAKPIQSPQPLPQDPS